MVPFAQMGKSVSPGLKAIIGLVEVLFKLKGGGLLQRSGTQGETWVEGANLGVISGVIIKPRA